MLSTRQLMNFSFNPVHLVNTYGAFGSITRVRNEIVLEGTDDPTITSSTTWREYEFKGKPGNPSLRPAQIAPYHLRLDWLMWLAAMSAPDEQPWLPALIVKLLQGDPPTLGHMRANTFSDRPPRYMRGLYYEYRFTTPNELGQEGEWWKKNLIGVYFRPA